jgi:hypothetical protein
MDHPPVEVTATLLAERFGDAYGGLVTPGMRQDLARRLEIALREAMQAGCEASARLCLERQALWEATEARSTTTEPMRAEARHRSNEAAYLADAIRSLDSSAV